MSTISPISLDFSLSLIANAPNAMVLVSASGSIIALNNAAERLFGYAPGELAGAELEILLPERYRAVHRETRREYQVHPVPRLMGSGHALMGLRKDGSEFDLEVGLSTVDTPHGPATLASVADISSRREAERREQHSRELCDAIFRSSPLAIVTSDSAGVITAANPALERMLWYTQEEMVGQLAYELLYDPDLVDYRSGELIEIEHSRDAVPEGHSWMLEHFVERGETRELNWHYRRKDGTNIPVKLSVSVLRDQDDEVVGFLGIAADLRDQYRTEQYIHHIAQHDELTGLPNRTQLHARLDAALAECQATDSRLALLLVDLDNFQRFNDSLGHNVGDQILLHAASKLKRAVGHDVFVARLGGDEFLVLLPGVTREDDVFQTAQRILTDISAPMVIGQRTLKITPSIGISLYPDHADDVDTLLMRADTAMYAAKERGRNHYRMFDAHMARQLSERVELENALQQALELEQFTLHYQSQIDLKTGQTVGVETLLRWELPGSGSISPARFIQVAEESELILPIGEWVLRKACEDGVKLQQAFNNPCVIAVNLSPRQLIQGDLVATVADALESSGLPPHLLELEITENIFMDHADELESTLQRIRALGVRIAIDDFGTGYSSLAYITRFPIDRIKLDLTFVQNMLSDANCRAVTNAVITMANGLGMDVVAEGVETDEQLNYLSQQSCSHAQGFLLAYPKPLHQLLN